MPRPFSERLEISMGMPVIVRLVDCRDPATAFSAVFDCLNAADEWFSTYKPTSEISQINAGLAESAWSQEMKQVLRLCEQTRQDTKGYFNIVHHGRRDPSGLVKGWAIYQAAQLLRQRNIVNFYLEVGGDIELGGHNENDMPWCIGIRNPFNRREIVKTLRLTDQGVATSGTAIRGQHIYNPLHPHRSLTNIASLTVIGPNVYEADRFATAAFAMGTAGIEFIDSRPGFEGYMIDHKGIASYTQGFNRYVI